MKEIYQKEIKKSLKQSMIITKTKQALKRDSLLFMIGKKVFHLSKDLKKNMQTPGNKIRLTKECRESSELKIILGYGGRPYPSWISSDMDTLNLLTPDDWEKYFQQNSVSAFLAEHVWEHLTHEEGKAAAKTCFQYLKPGGNLRVAVPDGYHFDSDYINFVKPGGVGPGASDHKVLYNYKMLSSLFIEIGFEVRLLEYFDENGQFHEVDWNNKNGVITRSKSDNPINENDEFGFTSIILDATKSLLTKPVKHKSD